MNQADISKLVSQLRINLGPRKKFRNPDGPEGRLKKMRKTVTALVKHERIELNYPRADEARGYAERVSNYSIKKMCLLFLLLFLAYFRSHSPWGLPQSNHGDGRFLAKGKTTGAQVI